MRDFMYWVFGLLLILLCGCAQEAQEEAGLDPTRPENIREISLKATMDIQTLAPVADMTFVPNSAFVWLSQMILLDVDGGLERVRIDGSRSVAIAKGPFTDIAALSRVGKPGLFFALGADGYIKAFIQSNDAGDFRQLPISAPPVKFKGFCDPDYPNEHQIIGLKDDGGVQSLSVTIREAMSVELKMMETDDQMSGLTFGPCRDHQRSFLYLREEGDTGQQLYLEHEGETARVKIEDGLSIIGLASPDFVTATRVKFGGAFHEGIIVAGDKTENRIVIIARDYALEQSALQ